MDFKKANLEKFKYSPDKNYINTKLYLRRIFI